MRVDLRQYGRGACWASLMIALVSLACDGTKPWNQTTRALASPLPAEGALDIADCERIHGWVWAPSAPDAALLVDIIEDNQVLGRVMANEFRQDLVDAGKGNGYHAFSMPTPIVLFDGREHAVAARVAGSEASVGGRSLTVRCDYAFPGRKGASP